MPANQDNQIINIEYMPLENLLRAFRNPKDHDLGTLNESLHRFGFTSPMLINETTGRLVAGHGRLDALQRMKASGKNPPNRIVQKNGSWLVPVIRGVGFPTDEEAEAYLLTDNRLVEQGGWLDDQLTQVLADLSAQGEEMLRGIGFDRDDVDKLLARAERELEKAQDKEGEGEGQDADEEELPPADVLLEKWGVQLGDIWQIGDHLVICGDSRQKATWQELLKTAGVSKANGIFTSPPYADQRSKSNVPNYQGVPEDQYVTWFGAISELCANYLQKDGSFFLNIKPNVVDGARVLYVFDLVLKMCRVDGWKLVDEFCWERSNTPGRWSNRFKNGFEPVYHFSRDTNVVFHPYAVAIPTPGTRTVNNNFSTGKYYNMDHKTVEWEEALPTNRIQNFGNAIGALHPAAFPAGLPEFFMRAFSDIGATWLDPFGGSGTLAIAAYKCERRALLIELEPKYVAVSLERISAVNGDIPERISAK